MGASSSTPSGAGEIFTNRYAALPDSVHKAVEALCAKGDTRLLNAHPSAPSPFPPVPVGIVVRLSHETASAALACVPRLQRKHYELIPKHMTELDFFISFFSHLTAIVDSQCAGAMSAPPESAAGTTDTAWRGDGSPADGDGSDNPFAVTWKSMADEKKALVTALASKESDVMLSPNVKAPPPFPVLPIGMECFIDEHAATSALAVVPGLQSKHYMTVPKKLGEKQFWVNFFSHVTAIVNA